MGRGTRDKATTSAKGMLYGPRGAIQRQQQAQQEQAEATLDKLFEATAGRGHNIEFTDEQVALLTADPDLAEELFERLFEQEGFHKQFKGASAVLAFCRRPEPDEQQKQKLRKMIYDRCAAEGEIDNYFWYHPDMWTDDVLDDIRNRRPGTEALIDHIENNCREQGGAHLFQHTGDGFDYYNISDQLLARILTNMPDQDKITQLLQEFVDGPCCYDSTNFNNYQNMSPFEPDEVIDGINQSFARRRSGNVIDEEARVRLAKKREEIAADYVRLTLSGNRGQAAEMYSAALAEELAANIGPRNINRRLPMFAPPTGGAQPGRDHPSVLWRDFKRKWDWVARRGINMSQDEWREALHGSFAQRNDVGHPFGVMLWPGRMLGGLSRHLKS